MKAYYEDESVTLYHGDMRDILLDLPLEVDCVVTDPPYGETSLSWDYWPGGWPSLIPASSMWCFGSMRMFLDRREEFNGWWLSQDVVWDKRDGSCLSGDRFMRVHEFALHWYRGAWGEVYHDQQREPHYGRRASSTRKAIKSHVYGAAGSTSYEDDGQRLVQTVLRSPNLRGRGLHPTEKPLGILDPLIRYACPPGGTVLDPFAGSGSTADAARASGRRAVLIEAHEPYCEVIARRLSQGDLFTEEPA